MLSVVIVDECICSAGCLGTSVKKGASVPVGVGRLCEFRGIIATALEICALEMGWRPHRRGSGDVPLETISLGRSQTTQEASRLGSLEFKVSAASPRLNLAENPNAPPYAFHAGLELEAFLGVLGLILSGAT